MQTAEIRRKFLDYFERQDHTVVPSASVVSPDPSVLFTIAGMVPFIPYLTGKQTPPYKRAVSVQKCVRTGDIEEVGRTTRHGTFFQMNGNFSFGDYFKAEALRFAWELSTGSVADGGLGFDADRIWVTVLTGDEETAQLWRDTAGLPDERIQERGFEDNYWSTGQPGPGGPCSEMYFDRGPDYGPDGGPVVDEDRFLEFWNLVFTQDQLSAVRSKTDFDVAGPLTAKNIDTGMGLERVAYLLQGVENMYETDEVFPVIRRAAELTGVAYGDAEGSDVALRVVGDHVRSSLMIMSDGVVPSNEGRGYVLRRLLRRSMRSMRSLGMDERCLPELLPVSLAAMKTSYPELVESFDQVADAAYAEESTFRRTLATGSAMLDQAVKQASSSKGKQLAGDAAFQLHDTYGFPIELTLEIAAEQGVAVDTDGFTRLMTEQRDRAKADARAKKQGNTNMGVYNAVAEGLGRSVEFTGYRETVSDGTVAAVLVGGEQRPAGAGDTVELVLDRTPFYAEGGGQLADMGTITLGSGAVVEVEDVQSPFEGFVVHRARVVAGEVTPGASVECQVDVGRRKAISRAHTATHMVHKAIREALGEQATQAGSENAPGRFRFDFHANSAVPTSVLGEVEHRVNAMLADDLEVTANTMTQEEAVAAGAMALFGEKYGDEVRVISVGDWAHELCGGTHVERSSQLGVVKLLGEASIGSGVRRVEALVGTDAYSFLAREHVLVAQLTEMLKVRPEDLVDRVQGVVAQLKDADKELSKIRSQALLAGAGKIADGAADVAGLKVVTHNAGEVAGGDDVRSLVLDVRGKLGADSAAVVAVAAVTKGRPVVVVATTEGARAAGVKAGALVKVAAATLGGGGGGKDDVAQGGGQDSTKIDAALTEVAAAVAATAQAR